MIFCCIKVLIGTLVSIRILNKVAVFSKNIPLAVYITNLGKFLQLIIAIAIGQLPAFWVCYCINCSIKALGSYIMYTTCNIKAIGEGIVSQQISFTNHSAKSATHNRCCYMQTW